MKLIAHKEWHKSGIRILKAPGMIEPIERRLLFEIGFQCDNLPIVEFGCFFGASTLALALGSEARQKQVQILYSIDAFEVDHNNSFHECVIGYAKQFGMLDLLVTNNSRTNYLGVTRSVLEGGVNMENIRLVQAVVGDDSDYSFLPETIGALHLDLPKDSLTFRPILRNAFPRLRNHSLIAFQDYAYHFSEELISFFELAISKQLITPIAIAASTMVFELRDRAEKLSASAWEDLLDKSLGRQKKLVNSAINRYKLIKSSRNKEIIALIGAYIRAGCRQESNSFQNIQESQYMIAEMISLDKDSAAHVLTQLINERYTPYQ